MPLDREERAGTFTTSLPPVFSVWISRLILSRKEHIFSHLPYGSSKDPKLSGQCDCLVLWERNLPIPIYLHEE